MHIHLERSTLLLPSACSWSLIWPFALAVTIVLLACQLYKRVFPAPVPSIFRRRASPMADKPVASVNDTLNRSFLGIFALENLPISLTVPQAPRYVGISAQLVKPTPSSIALSQLRRGSPPPSSKGVEAKPVSMAKIIMSRHVCHSLLFLFLGGQLTVLKTFRKPTIVSSRTSLPRRPPPVALLRRSPSPEDPERAQLSPPVLSSERPETQCPV